MAATWYNCEVGKAGVIGDVPSTTFVLKELGNRFDGHKELAAHPDKQKEMLAVGLAAISCGLRVDVFADLETGIINRMHLARDGY